MQEQLQRIRPLFQEERQQALQNAKEAVRRSFGASPKPEQFATRSKSKYPQWFNGLVFALCIVVLIAAFVPSAMRLYHAGHDAYLHGLDSNVANAVIAGIAIVLLAETTQLIATLALAMIEANSQRVLLYTTAALATCIAVVGNVFVAQPTDPFANAITWQLVFAWLDAISPPLIVLSVANVLKHLALDAIQQHHASQQAYNEALAKWQADVAKPAEEHPRWQEFYTDALQDAIRRANSNIRRADWHQLDRASWIYLLQREMNTRTLHEEVQQSLQKQPEQKQMQAPKQPEQSGGGGGNATGEVIQAMQSAKQKQSMFAVQCPVCAETFERDSKVGAARALSAHMKKHRNEERAAASGGLPESPDLVHATSSNGRG